VTVERPGSVDDALDAYASRTDAHLLAGGTDFMVEVNDGRRRPPAVISLSGVSELRGWEQHDGEVVLGAGLTYTDMERGRLAALVPALAQAARTVGSPPIRNAGTVGGNVGTASPAGDTLPVLAALDAVVTLCGPSGERHLPLREFVIGPKQTAMAAGEIITAVRFPLVEGPQEFLKVGTRNAMVISVVVVALVVDVANRSVRCGLGSVAPVPLRAEEAEAWIAGRIDWDRSRLDDPLDADTFGAMVAAAARPIDDHRSTAAYRRHAVGVCARRALERAFGPGAAERASGERRG
jgi:CO/xanthine dehydrogenase FAD-binding subunit